MISQPRLLERAFAAEDSFAIDRGIYSTTRDGNCFPTEHFEIVQLRQPLNYFHA